jgi:hypothetical protein
MVVADVLQSFPKICCHEFKRQRQTAQCKVSRDLGEFQAIVSLLKAVDPACTDATIELLDKSLRKSD